MAVSRLRAIVAKQVSVAIGLREEQVLPLIYLPPVSKKRCGGELSLPIKSLNHLQNPGKKLSKTELKTYASAVANKITCSKHIENIDVDTAQIHFKINSSEFVQCVLGDINSLGTLYGIPRCNAPKKEVVIEYSSPNIAKPFHAGHLRSTVIGHFLRNLHSLLGHHVTSINYLGDWGVQFGILAAGLKSLNKSSSSLSTRELFDVYVKANQEAELNSEFKTQAREIFKDMEDGDDSILHTWQKIRDQSINEYSHTYKRLGIHFDEYSGESMYTRSAQELINHLHQEKILQKAVNGTDIIDLSPNSTVTNYATLTRSDGTSMYITRDLAAAIDRFKRYQFDNMYYVVDKSQTDHFSKLFQTISKIGYDWSNRCKHVSFGRVLGMSTRKGNVVFLEDIIEEAKAKMLENMRASKTTKSFDSIDEEENVAETLGLSAIIVQDLKARLSSDYTFEWDRAFQSQGDTGVFLQYTHARLSSIHRLSGVSLNPEADTNLLLEEEAIKLVHHLALFEGAIHTAYTELEPRHIVHYLFKLCHLISAANRALQVKGAPREISEARLLLLNYSQQCLCRAMEILGLRPLYRM
ncbi:probable arginine--tRNA ligase, mitochondrial [Anneissia japonica]|uniref:probable arginine--tRNA ligase, mitochondrial n=1 Tax=Anneissia japonica TaxID=1529436 RepID=UPI001425BA34|nr:probable arginine--tRNA ligase, mitochondrial [Anneissia japonica]